MPPIQILFVDDEQNLLDGFKRRFHRHKNWVVRYATGGEEALRMLEKQPCDVIVSDIRMPGMDGVELLTRVADQYPETIRYILSGYSDRAMILNSMSVAHQYFNKPCNLELLEESINVAIRVFGELRNSRIQKLLASIKNLPSPPTVYEKLSHEFRTSDPSMEKVVDIVKTDPAISAKILHLVNSAFFGFRDSITDIAQAAMMLGTDVIRSLVLVTGVVNATFRKTCPGVILDRFSSHSISVAFLAYDFSKWLGWNREMRESAFTAGLLHDIGRLVLISHFQDYIRKIPDSDPDSRQTITQERDTFDVDHAEIGAALLSIWGLPVPVVNTVMCHHQPSLTARDEIGMPTVVHVADVVSHNQTPGSPIDVSLFDPDIIHRYDLTNKIHAWMMTSSLFDQDSSSGN